MTAGPITLDFKLVERLWNENPLLLLALLALSVVIVFVLTPRASELISWLSNRRRRNIAQINEWISLDLSSEAKDNLHDERERLMLLVTRGISASRFMRKALVEISESTVPNGISWSDLRLARGYLEMNAEKKELAVRFKRGTWAHWWLRLGIYLISSLAFLSGLVAVVFFLFSLSLPLQVPTVI